MDKEKDIKNQEKPKGSDDRLDLAVFDHVKIIDKKTGETLINKRG